MSSSQPRTTASSLCRLCHVQCPVEADMIDGRVAQLRGAPGNSVYEGFTCSKGRELPGFHTSSERLLHSVARDANGNHEPIALPLALDRIASTLKDLLGRYGPRSIALYIGTHGYNNLLTAQTAMAFMEAIESPMTFTSVTIDQPGKAISAALHGTWLAGPPSIEQADVWLATGTNPMHSMLGPVNPGRTFGRARERGMQLIVIDPRRTEFARRADVHLQARPGEDPTVLAGIARVILDERLHDEPFLDHHAAGTAGLRAALDPFTPDYVEQRADVPAADLIRAARIYASGRRGVAVAGTGPNMSGRGNLTEYLSKALMTLCGHWLQEGDPVPNPGVFINWPPALAQAVGPSPAWGFGERLRVRGLGGTAAGLPTAAAADEMLIEGEGRVRALLNLGGNPLLAWPDQRKTHEALQKLDLLVSIDPVLSATGRLSDYVIAPTMFFESPGCSALSELLGGYVGWGYAQPYGQWAPRLADPPPGADVVDDWKVLHGLASRLGRTLTVNPISFLDPATQAERAVTLSKEEPPSTEELWDLLLDGSPVSLDEVKRHPQGHVFHRDRTVEAGVPAKSDRLDVGNDTMLAELGDVASEPLRPDTDDAFPFRLISRRLPHVHNSSWHEHERQRGRSVSNPGFMHPADLDALGLEPGAIVEITSRHATITGTVESDPDVRRGVVSMPHCFGAAPGEDDARRGGSTSRLSSTDVDYDPYTGIPRMSTLPVRVTRPRKGT